MTTPASFPFTPVPAARRLLVTGAEGFLGRGLVQAVAGNANLQLVLATDVRTVPPERQLRGVLHRTLDVRDAQAVSALVAEHRIDTVVHLASIVTPGKWTTRSMEYAVDVEGSRHIIDACVQHGVRHLVVSSSGAAYGYHPENAPWITEDHTLRGHAQFAYAQHKRMVEEMLAEARARHPELQQTVFRIGTILGDRVDNQITALFEKRRLLAIAGSDSPFVFVWDDDVIGAMRHAISGLAPAGCFNLAGDGALPIAEIAQRLGKSLRVLPAGLLRTALAWGAKLGLTRYGPEQLDFLRYRPVLLNTALKERFGYVPGKSSAEAFEAWVRAREAQGRPVRARA
jgi:UDP-glucose 4-epimerase